MRTGTLKPGLILEKLLGMSVESLSVVAIIPLRGEETSRTRLRKACLCPVPSNITVDWYLSAICTVNETNP